ncbi:hypothetical protein [Bacillus sp. NPDC077027]|uniref:hypothetical protein n=1 Tax=Bacillus sp. NPDC077027 TaxID=3390548 RepID=UPI003CFE2877
MIYHDQFQLIQKALTSTSQELHNNETGQSVELETARMNLELALAHRNSTDHAFLVRQPHHHRSS